jgi:hypothetical protein
MARALIFLGFLVVISTTGVAWALGDEDSTSGSPQPSTIVPMEATETGQPPVEVTPEAAPTSAPPPPPPPNRLDCAVIRGTEYLSGAERAWFLAHCVR